MKETRPILRRVKNANNHDRLLKWLVKNQVVVESRNNEPTDLRVTRSHVANASSKFGMLHEKISSVEDGSANTLRRIGIISSNAMKNSVQIAFGLWTQPGADHDRRRNSSVVLACSRFSSPSSSSRSSSGVITISIP